MDISPQRNGYFSAEKWVFLRGEMTISLRIDSIFREMPISPRRNVSFPWGKEMGHYFQNKVEVIGFASPRIGKVLKFRGHEVSEEF